MAERRGTRPARRRQSAKQTRDNPESIEADDVSIDFEELGDFEESTNICIYGPTGHGKTALAAGAPNAVIMRTESGVKTAKMVGSKARVLNATTWPKIEASTRKADRELGPEDWLIVDSGNRAQLEYVRWLLRTIHEQNSSRDLDIPALQDHQKWQNAYMRWADHIIDAPYNSIFLFIEMTRETEDGDEEILPLIRGGKHLEVCRHIMSQFDMILYYAMTDKSDPPGMRRLLAQPHPATPMVAKDRYGVLGQYVDIGDEDYTAMADIIATIKDGQ